LKVGQFELPYAYSPVTHLITITTPLLFGAGIQGNDVRVGAPMRGIQLSGLIADRARLYIAYGAPSLHADGNVVGEREFFGEFRDLFLRVSNADLARNFGFFAYFTRPTRNPNDPNTRQDGQRYGLDGTLEWRGFQFFAMAVYGEDSHPLGT